MESSDVRFSGSIPALYHRCLGPLLFEPYAQDLAGRAAEGRPRRILETAAGTGIVTEALAAALPDADIVATDLNQAMLDEAASRLGADRIEWREADAQALPFEDASFDAVVCQFGAMFFPDRAAAYREARRVLRPGGRFLFNVWDRLEANPVSAACARAVADLFPDDPPSFLSRVPFGYHDRAAIEGELRSAGFSDVSSETVSLASCVVPEQAARGLCLGSPLRSEIEARDSARLDEAAASAARALARVPLDAEGRAPMSAHVFVAIA
jgi:ubiquinone/menaquinone biosynthesis C-methylase UbiE